MLVINRFYVTKLINKINVKQKNYNLKSINLKYNFFLLWEILVFVMALAAMAFLSGFKNKSSK
jgi:hypothetical protein